MDNRIFFFRLLSFFTSLCCSNFFVFLKKEDNKSKFKQYNVHEIECVVDCFCFCVYVGCLDLVFEEKDTRQGEIVVFCSRNKQKAARERAQT